MDKPTKPTHNLCMKKRDEEGGKWVQIGAGWMNDRNAISVRLNMGVTLSWRDMERYSLYLFKNKFREDPKPPEPVPPPTDDDVPY